jgi:hypothetical protein
VLGPATAAKPVGKRLGAGRSGKPKDDIALARKGSPLGENNLVAGENARSSNRSQSQDSHHLQNHPTRARKDRLHKARVISKSILAKKRKKDSAIDRDATRSSTSLLGHLDDASVVPCVPKRCGKRWRATDVGEVSA